MNTNTAVVFVHGLWMTGLESFALRHHVTVNRGWQWRTFHYHSVAHHPDDVVRGLDAAVRRLDADRVHLVGHSLGGLLIHRALQMSPDWPDGRVVFLGTPAVGSQAAANFRALPLGDFLLGHAAGMLLDPRPRTWDFPRPLGIIAGTEALSFGELVTRFGPEPNDGMVAVTETRLPGAADHIALPVGHSTMLFSTDVAAQVCAFLDNGRFER